MPAVLERPKPDSTIVNAVRSAVKRATGEVVHRAWATAVECAAIGPKSRRGRSFGRFGDNSVICFPANTIFNEHYIHIGSGTMIGPGCTLSAGMVPGQQCISDPVVSIGDRCLIGKGSGIVGHFEIVIGNDVWTGHNVYITDQNHDYRDVTIPISKQSMPERSVIIGDGSWLGYGSVVLPGSRIGKHVVVGANSVVSGDLPDYSVAVGSPARVIRRWSAEDGWHRVS
ncbi:MAG: putative sugar acetyltransferase [Ilumatobacteraceae bacterium]|nr:putative sugar acetyltransferase [Ilumatobacteraceae bacterium]